MITKASIGSIAEIKVAAKFVEYGMTVFFPFNDNSRIDMIAEYNGKVYRIQIKSSSYLTENNSISYSLEHNGLYDDTQIDYFVFYNNITGSMCMVDINDPIVQGKTSISFRTSVSKNNLVRKVNYEQDYVIDDVIKTKFGLRKLTYKDSKIAGMKNPLKNKCRHSKAKLIKPTKEELKNNFKDAKNIKDVADKYNITVSTLRSWCKGYNFSPEECGISRWITRKVGESALVEKTCPTCGKKFKGKSKKIYCSHECNVRKFQTTIDKDKDKIIEMFVKDGLRPYKIAERLHHDSDTVKRILIENGIRID